MREKLAKVKKGLGIAIFVIIAVLIVATVVASVFSKSRNKPIFVFGNTLLWVETESMEPTIEARSFISAKKYDGKGVKQGDIITFICTDTSSEVYGRLITHRVEKVVDGGYKTKGDNSLSHTDSWTVKDDDIVAVYGGNLKIFTFVGRVFLSPAGLILIVATFIFSCAFIYIPDMINAVKESDGADGKSEKEKEIDRRVQEEVEKMLKNDRSDGDEKN